MGPVQSVMTVGMIAASPSSHSPIGLMLGAVFGVALRVLLCEAIMLSIVLASRRKRRGLRGGGGPGLSETLRGYREDAMLDARCKRTGWLAKRRGEGCLISTSFSRLGCFTGNSSCGSDIFGRAVLAGLGCTGWLESARQTSKERLVGCSYRSPRYESAMETADSGSGVGGLDAAGRTGEDEWSTTLTVFASPRDIWLEDFRGDVGVLRREWSLLQVSNHLSSTGLERASSEKDMDTRDSRTSWLDSISSGVILDREIDGYLSSGASSAIISSKVGVGTWSAKYRCPVWY